MCRNKASSGTPDTNMTSGNVASVAVASSNGDITNAPPSIGTVSTTSSSESLLSLPDKQGLSVGKARANPMTREEVLKRSNPETLCLMIIEDKVYDCTRWQHIHPGGFLTIRPLCGKDATDPFQTTHPKHVQERILNKFYYADLNVDDDAEVTAADEATLAFRKLTRHMEEAGLFETNYTFYYKKAAAYTTMFLLVLAGVLFSDNLVVHGFAGALLGLFWQQMAFIGHDLGHNAITHDRVLDSCWGIIVGNLMTGISVGWWKRSHNVHHIVTNSVDYDPDIQHLPVMAVDPAFLAKPIFSTYQGQYLQLDRFAHFFVSMQHWLYYPIMAVARVNLYIQSINHALVLDYYTKTKDLVWRRDLQIATLAGFWTWLIALTMQLPTWQSRVLFLGLAHVVAGILHVQITISHFAMPVHAGVTYDDSSNGYLHTQLQGTMDIECPTYMDWFHGGIQFQVVHHLWPRLPRHNLRRVKTLLVAFCKEHGLEYKQAPFLKANLIVIEKLRETAEASEGFSSFFSESMNLSG
ncbi:fatty acid desaturase [Nitzschia inconspicua]|uniref:Fatty acid desaturase n=1 Tax=Nitzschia inconspicua TaxID=303405 RepID=A0A9K3KKB7_9STRA|nr:fatty acid desaturase [Nitzschia inconspicua]